MDIRNWPLDQIMQLPDYLFGRRWPIGVCPTATEGNRGWDIAEIALPEKCVIWNMFTYVYITETSVGWFRLALGDQLPTTAAQMTALEPMFNGVGYQGAGPRQIPAQPVHANIDWKMRMPIESGGRRIIAELTPTGQGPGVLQFVFTISSIPKEVPDCLL